jgi:RNA polymerase sigma-70 factor (ECF subfamily)
MRGLPYMSGHAATAAAFISAMEQTPSDQRDDTNPVDFALMERIAHGDHVAFGELVGRHQDAVVGTAVRMLGNFHDAEDIAQQVFLRIWRNARHYRPDAKFTTYLFTITRNLVFNETRRRGRKKEVSAEEREETAHRMIEDKPEYRPDSGMLHKELRDAVDAAIAALPENQRMAVVLRRYEQLPYEEIATVLALSVPAVKSLLFRARTTLRESLAAYLDDGTD